MLEIRNVNVVYDPNTIFRKEALTNVSLQVSSGESIAIIGKIGSGKSTLIQLFNGLVKPDEGEVLLDGVDINTKNVSRKEIIRKVGIVFQYPEEQFFAETVFEEVAFGPRNLDFSQKEIKECVYDALRVMGFDPPSIIHRTPFSLSGGEKRRVAIASVIAMRPEILILDEPTAGMDYAGKTSVISHIREGRAGGLTTAFVTHDMEEAFYLANRIIALDSGFIVFDGSPEEFFSNRNLISQIGLEAPFVLRFREKLLDCLGEIPFSKNLETLVDLIGAMIGH